MVPAEQEEVDEPREREASGRVQVANYQLPAESVLGGLREQKLANVARIQKGVSNICHLARVISFCDLFVDARLAGVISQI